MVNDKKKLLEKLPLSSYVAAIAGAVILAVSLMASSVPWQNVGGAMLGFVIGVVVASYFLLLILLLAAVNDIVHKKQD